MTYLHASLTALAAAFLAPVTLASAALAAFLLAAPAAAQSAPDMARLEILPGWRDASGRHVAGLRIALDPGWKTYWRAPGDAGIPPSFDWAGSRNIAGAEVSWPTPKVFSANGLTSIGYVSDVILPIVFTARDPSAPIRLEGRIDLGVCEDICVPVSMKVAADLPAGVSSPDPRIVAALAARPASGAEAGMGPMRCSIAPSEDGVRLTALAEITPRGKGEHAVLEVGGSNAWVSEADTLRDAGQLSASVDVVPPRGAPFVLDRSQVTMTVLGPEGAVELRGCSGS